jgi:hypothetical protein
MKDGDFKALCARASELHALQPRNEKNKVSLDAIFISLASGQESTGPAKRRRVTEEPAPEWFNETLKKLRGSGEKITIGRFLLLSGKFPATRSDSLSVGRWLREAGIPEQKTGGNILFEM